MRKIYNFNYMFGDGDSYDNVRIDTKNKREIALLDYFSEKIFNDDIFDCIRRPDLFEKGYGNLTEDELKEVNTEFEKMVKGLYDNFDEDYTLGYDENAPEVKKIENLINFVEDTFDIHWYDSYGDICNPESSSCIDVSDKIVMNKTQVIEMVKDKLGIDLYIK